jgi:hydrophobe/amphiphile efflux-1 (HAE1) family protein
MSLPELSIRRPVFAWMLMAAIMLFGAISFKRLGISQLPDVDMPVVSVSVSLPGAAPEVIESQVLDPIEDAIMEIDGIRNVTSQATQASGSIAVEFEFDRDIDMSMQAIQNKINQVQNVLPVNLLPPTLRKSNPEDIPFIWMALTSDDPKERPIDLMIYARNVLYDQFSTLPGVSNIALGGYVNPALRVWANLDKMDKYSITSDDVLQSIFDGHLENPIGIINNDKREANVRLIGEAYSPEEFGTLQINSRAVLGPNYHRIQLKELATVEEGLEDVYKLAYFNDHRTVGLGILKQHGANAVEIGEEVRKKMEYVKYLLPKKYHLDIRTDNTRFIKQSVDSLLFTLALSALLTGIVCYIFLGSLTSTFNVLMAIPTSIVGAFTAFFFLNFTLNTFTLLGLSLAIGIVVDDAIMMLENIVRHREMGQGKKVAALNGANEITFAALAATIAVVAIFLPVVFVQGVIGKFLLQFGITVTVAVMLSLLEALTLTPMRCSRYLTVEHNPKGLAGFMNRVFAGLALQYQRVLVVLLRHRWKTLGVATVVFAISMFTIKFLPVEMMPPQDQSMFVMRYKLPVDTAITETNKRLNEVADDISSHPEIDGVFTMVGGFGGNAANQGNAMVTMVDPKNRKETQAQFINRLRKDLKKKYKGMEIVIQDMSLRGFSASRGFPVEFIVQGPDWDKLTDYTNKIMDKLKEGHFLNDVNTDVQADMPEVKITPNRAKLAQNGVSLITVTNVINALVGGQIINGKTMYQKDNHRYELELRLVAGERDKLPDLDRIKFRNNRGEVTKLTDVVDYKVGPSLMLISRLNRARAIIVYGSPAVGVSQQDAMIRTEKIARSMLPQGYSLKMTGNSQSFQESNHSLLFALLFGILVSYMVLASQFNSFIHPVTVLLALPFSVSGAFLGLLLFHQSLNLYSEIGLILLMGIVKKNSILLVDFTNQMRAEGHDVTTALLKACPVRLRPILMTSVAIVAGALPEAMSLGPGAETTIPMSIALIGGVIASTFLTLFIVPCAYSLLSYFEKPDSLDNPKHAATPVAAHPVTT